MPFTALCGADFVETDLDLSRLLSRVAELGHTRGPEDCAVWFGLRLVVVVHGDGRLTWLLPEYRLAAEERWTIAG